MLINSVVVCIWKHSREAQNQGLLRSPKIADRVRSGIYASMIRITDRPFPLDANGKIERFDLGTAASVDKK